MRTAGCGDTNSNTPSFYAPDTAHSKAMLPRAATSPPLLLYIFLHGASSAGSNDMTDECGYTYKHQFLPDEVQHCCDVSSKSSTADHHSMDCQYLTVSGTEMVLTMWAWDQGWGNQKGQVWVTATADDNWYYSSATTTLVTYDVGRSDGEDQKPLRVREVVDVSDVESGSVIEVKYSVGDGGGHELDVRDVRIEFRDDSSDSYFGVYGEEDGDEPPTQCDALLQSLSVAMAVISGVGGCFVGLLVVRSGFRRRLAPKAGRRLARLVQWWCFTGPIFLTIGFSVLSNFFDGYGGGSRCKDTTQVSALCQCAGTRAFADSIAAAPASYRTRSYHHAQSASTSWAQRWFISGWPSHSCRGRSSATTCSATHRLPTLTMRVAMPTMRC